MDVFAVFKNDGFGVIEKLGRVGIKSIYIAEVMASGATWYEEEGIYIGNARLVVAIADDELMGAVCKGYALNVAANRGKPIYALLSSDDPALREQMQKRWPSAVLFDDVNALISAVVEFQLDNRTPSGLSIKANMYYRAFMLDEAIAACNECVEMLCAEDEASVGFLKVEAKVQACEMLTMLAEIYHIMGDHLSFEGAILRALKITSGSNVIWAKDNALYLKHILLRLYSSYLPNEEEAARLSREVEGKCCFGFDEKDAVRNTERMLQRVSLFYEKCRRMREKREEEAGTPITAPKSNIHRAIAEHIESSIILFNELAEGGVRIGFVECLRTGYERLMEYCRLVGEKELALRCMDLLAANLSTEAVFVESQSDESLLNLKCIKAYLGEKQPDSGFFDVFISHRSADTEMAASVYSHIKTKGKEPFLDRVCLPVLGDSEYRNSILDAIDKSAHFVLVSSDLKFLESRWVSEECNLFCDEKREGRKNGNFIMVFPRAVCAEIFATNKRCLPIQLRSFEIVAFEDFEATLMNYII